MIRTLALLTALLVSQAMGQNAPNERKPKAPKPPEEYARTVPKPTVSEIAYGEHERHILDFWKAESETPTPLAFIIHGGGWQGGSKERANKFGDVAQLLDAGISVAAINYRYVNQAVELGIEPPVKAPLHDAARALQFVRSKAEEWNLDKERIGAAGGSAGACSSLWLAFHDDLADPDSDDPVARESTRLWCAAVIGAQTTLDPQQMKEWTPNSRYGGHAFGLPNFAVFLAERESILPWIAEYSPYALVSKDDPPIFMTYSRPPALGEEQKDPTHTANFGVKLQEHCLVTGVECELVYPGASKSSYVTTTDFLIAKLKSPGDDFVSLLNGEDLSGWEGDANLWKVEDGVVTGTCEGPDAFEHNTFLIWTGGTVKDFELRATVRIVGDNNSGIQYRSRKLPERGEWAITGYQCDIHPAIEHTGMTYEEKGRGIFGLNGKNVMLDDKGARWLLSEHEPVAADLSLWNEFTVIARGNHLIHKVNGRTTSELIDHHAEGRAMEGLLAIQLHRGNAHQLEIKDMRLKVLEDGTIIPFDPDNLPEGAKRIDRPRTSRPEGKAPVPPRKAKS
ncbi:MAG: family 16 glycoside hydrolase [Verrucomicrobiota bacterium]